MTASRGKVPEYAGDKFELFVQQFSLHFIANNIIDTGKGKAVRLSSLPAEMFRLLSDFSSPVKVLDDAITYEPIVKILDDCVKPSKSPQLSRSEFYNLVRLPNERAADFVARLNHLPGDRHFGDDRTITEIEESFHR